MQCFKEHVPLACVEFGVQNGGTEHNQRAPTIRLETVVLLNTFRQFYSEKIRGSGRNRTYNLCGTDPLL